MEGSGTLSRRERFLAKAEKYINKNHPKETSSGLNPSGVPSVKGAGGDDGGSNSYKAYLQKAKEFMQKNKDPKANDDAGDSDRKKQYAAIATGLLVAAKKYKGRTKRKSSSKEGEGEGEEQEEEAEEEDGGWFSDFIEQMSEFFGEE